MIARARLSVAAEFDAQGCALRVCEYVRACWCDMSYVFRVCLLARYLKPIRKLRVFFFSLSLVLGCTFVL